MLLDCDNSWASHFQQRRKAIRSCRAGVVSPSNLSVAASIHVDVEVADLLAQGVAVDAQKIGGADLVAARGGERGGEKRPFHFAQDAVIEAGRRQAFVEFGKVVGEIALDRI